MIKCHFNFFFTFGVGRVRGILLLFCVCVLEIFFCVCVLNIHSLIHTVFCHLLWGCVSVGQCAFFVLG